MQDKFDLYRDLVLEKNKYLNLTAITDKEDFDQRNIQDSLKVLEFHTFKEGEKVLDLGTGGGLPGIPLAIARPDLHFTLVDARRKKIRFLEELIRELKLTNVSVIATRAEELGRDKAHREQYDALVTRALAPLRVLLEYSIPLLKVEGKLFAFKGPKAPAELNESANALHRLHAQYIQTFHYPLADAQHQLLVFEKRKRTSPEFPRSPGTPSNKPL